MKKNAWIVSAALLLSACEGDIGPPRTSVVPGAPRHAPVPVGEFEGVKVTLSDHEYVYELTVPDYGLPAHCIVFVNDQHKTTNMRCSQ